MISLPKRYDYKDLINIILILFVCIIFKIFLAFYSNDTADACGYLDITRNIISGKGIVTSYNLYQYWPGNIYYPALPYMQFLFSIIITPVYYIFRTIESVSVFNVFIAGLNSVLLYIFLSRYYRKNLAFWAAFLVGIAPQMQFTSIFPWTEQMHICFLIAGLMMAISGIEKGSNSRLFSSGVMMCLGYFVRVANLYAVAAFLISFWFLRKNYKGMLNKAAIFTAGFMAVLIPFQAFCLIKYKVFYPEYPSISVVYRLSKLIPGAYYSHIKPVLRILPLNPTYKIHLFLKYFMPHITDFLINLGLIVFFVIPLAIWVFRRRRIVEVFLFTLSITTIIFYVLTFYWLPVVEIFRYSLIPVISLLPLVLIMAWEVKTIFKKEYLNRLFGNWVFILIVSILAFVYTKEAVEWNIGRGSSNYIHKRKYFYGLQHEVLSWVDNNAGQEDLIATDLVQNTHFLGRPIVSLPIGMAMGTKNIADYLDIYKPRLILISRAYRQLVLNIPGYGLVFHNPYCYIFKRK